eukprot:1309997-Rhodomonas_salina.3
MKRFCACRLKVLLAHEQHEVLHQVDSAAVGVKSRLHSQAEKFSTVGTQSQPQPGFFRQLNSPSFR